MNSESPALEVTATGGPIAVLGRYALYDEFARGGMASVHFGRLAGARGFGRIVAIKRMHKHLAADPKFATMFIDEALMAARIQHVNVVPTLDVVAVADEVFLVMEYVRGESLAFLQRQALQRGIRIPPRICSAIMAGVLQGLHAAHEATSPQGEPLCMVHRDVSPHNVLVGADGVPKVFDFGVAKATGRKQDTTVDVVKGKCAYLAPEQLLGGKITRQVDVFAAATVFWELLTGARLFLGDTPGATVANVLSDRIPKTLPNDVPIGIREAIYKGLSREPEDRFATALEFAEVIERTCGLVPSREVGMWVEQLAGDRIHRRAEYVAMIESHESSGSVDRELLASISTEPQSRSESSTRGNYSAPGLARASSVPDRSAATLVAVLHPTRRRLGVMAGGLVGLAILGGGIAMAFQRGAAQLPANTGGTAVSATAEEMPTAQAPVQTAEAPAEAPSPPVATSAVPAASAAPEETAEEEPAPAPRRVVRYRAPIRRSRPAPKPSAQQAPEPSTPAQPSVAPPPVDSLYSRD